MMDFKLLSQHLSGGAEKTHESRGINITKGLMP